MIGKGDRAPDFTLPGTEADGFSKYRLSEYTDAGAVVLAFYPFDFSPVCTDELCGFRDAEWLSMTPDVDVFGISTDACYAHERFMDEYDLTFPLLSDTTGEVAERYGVAYDEWELHTGVPRRSIFVIDSNQTARHVWSTEDAYDTPVLTEIYEAIAGFHGPVPGGPWAHQGG